MLAESGGCAWLFVRHSHRGRVQTPCSVPRFEHSAILLDTNAVIQSAATVSSAVTCRAQDDQRLKLFVLLTDSVAALCFTAVSVSRSLLCSESARNKRDTQYSDGCDAQIARRNTRFYAMAISSVTGKSKRLENHPMLCYSHFSI